MGFAGEGEVWDRLTFRMCRAENAAGMGILAAGEHGGVELMCRGWEGGAVEALGWLEG